MKYQKIQQVIQTSGITKQSVQSSCDSASVCWRRFASETLLKLWMSFVMTTNAAVFMVSCCLSYLTRKRVKANWTYVLETSHSQRSKNKHSPKMCKHWNYGREKKEHCNVVLMWRSKQTILCSVSDKVYGHRK